MRIRKVISGVRQFGHGQQDFWVNVPEGVAQLVGSRLGLWQGQWFLATSAGAPWATQVLGKYTGSTRDIAIRSVILGTQGMAPNNAIENYSSSFDASSRVWTVNATLNTQFGQIVFKGVN